MVTAAETVATLGLGDLLIPVIAGEYAQGGLAAFDAIHLAISLPVILAPTEGIAGAGIWWGYSAIASGPGAC